MDRTVDYSLITEAPGLQATEEQLARLYHRYRFAKEFAKNKDVLEVACGSGMGLGYLAEVANKVVGGDIDEKNIALAKKIYQNRKNTQIELMDAHVIDHPDGSFDLVLLYEALYYLREPKKFVSEASRLLKKNGVLIVCTVNKDWADFHPSDYTYQYFSAPELYDLFKNTFPDVKLFGAFRIENKGLKNAIISVIKRAAVKFDLIPGSLKARAYLKRIFMGRLHPLPEEISEDMTPYEEPVPIPSESITQDFKIIYAVARK